MNTLHEIINFFRSPYLPEPKGDNPPFIEPEKVSLKLRICELVGINENMLFARTRQREIIDARRLFFYIVDGRPCDLQRETGFDHATVHYHRKNAVNIIQTEKKYCKIANQLFSEIRDKKVCI